MSDDEFKAITRTIAATVVEAIERQGIKGDEITAVLTVSFMEALNTRLGPVGTVERLRDVADLAERQWIN